MSKEVKHTPGPWRISRKDGMHRDYTGICGKEHLWDGLACVVVRMQGDEEDSAEGIANANLIAAAPALKHELIESTKQMRLAADLLEAQGFENMAVALRVRVKMASAILAEADGSS